MSRIDALYVAEEVRDSGAKYLNASGACDGDERDQQRIFDKCLSILVCDERRQTIRQTILQSQHNRPDVHE